MGSGSAGRRVAWAGAHFELDQEDPLKEGMAIHSSIVVWRIPLDRGAWQATWWSRSQTVTKG